MDLTAYRAIEANRWRSRFVAGLNGAVIAFLFAFAVWIFGPDAVRPASYLFITIGSAMFGGREVVLKLLGARELVGAEEKRLFRRLDVISVGLGMRALPAVHLVVSPYPNALAIERLGQAGTLVVTNRLLDLEDDELDGILAHEMFHLASAFVGLRSVMALFRGLVMSLIATRILWHRLAIAVVFVLAMLALGPAPLVFLVFVAIYLIAEARIARQREYLADAQAVLVTRHPEGLISALRRLGSVDLLAESVAPRARSFNADGERLAASLGPSARRRSRLAGYRDCWTRIPRRKTASGGSSGCPRR
jgi:heat shock protein HtpX